MHNRHKSGNPQKYFSAILILRSRGRQRRAQSAPGRQPAPPRLPPARCGRHDLRCGTCCSYLVIATFGPSWAGRPDPPPRAPGARPRRARAARPAAVVRARASQVRPLTTQNQDVTTTLRTPKRPKRAPTGRPGQGHCLRRAQLNSGNSVYPGFSRLYAVMHQ